MNILFIVPYTPNLIRVRSYNLIRHLAKKGHQITLATLYSDESEREDIEYLKSVCHSVTSEYQSKLRSMVNAVRALPSSTPLQYVYCWNPNLADRLVEIVTARLVTPPFDIIHIEHLRGAKFGTYLKSKGTKIPIVWDSVDCISYLFKQASEHSRKNFSRFITRLELKRTQKQEGDLACRFDRILITSPVDRKALIDLVPDGKPIVPISVLPNGVDREYFRANSVIPRESQSIIFSGKMSYHANVSMVLYLAEQILPHVWREKPQTRFYIVGKDPTEQVLNLTKNPQVTVTGTVEDIRPYLWKGTIAVVPLLYGAGLQNKLLEAMACGLPVVTTSRAISPLQIKAGRDILVADQPEEFAQAILRLLEDESLRLDIGQAGMQYVNEYHDWANIAGILENVYIDVIEKH